MQNQIPVSASVGQSISFIAERRYDKKVHVSSEPLGRVKTWAYQWLVLLASAIFTALCGSLNHVVANYLSSLRLGHCRGSFLVSKSVCCLGNDCSDWIDWHPVIQPFIFVGLSVLYSSAASFLVQELAPETAVSGIPELQTYFEGFEMPGLLGPMPLAVKAVGLIFSLSSGLWIGQEGPLVHLASASASVLSSYLLENVSEARLRDISQAAAAAGVSVSFMAPIGGVLFVLEVFRPTIKGVLWQGFACAMAASVVFSIIDPYRTGKVLYFSLTDDRVWHVVELVPFLLIGLITGAMGAFVIKLNTFFTAKYAQLRGSRTFLVCIGTLVTAVLSFPSSLGSESLHVLNSQLFVDCHANTSTAIICGRSTGPLAFELLYALLIGLVLTPATFGLNLPGGIILPGLVIGALTGRLIGIIVRAALGSWKSILDAPFCPNPVESLEECITPGAYAIVGAASALTGLTKLTVTSVVILFELTGSLNYIVPMMFSVMAAKFVSDYFCPLSIYENWTESRSYPLVPAKPQGPVPPIRASDIYRPLDEVVKIYTTDSPDQLRAVSEASLVYSYPVLDQGGQFLGSVNRSALVAMLSSGSFDLMSIVDSEVVILSPSTFLITVLNCIKKLGLHTIFFVHRGKLEGIMSRMDAWRALRTQETYRSRRMSNHDLSVEILPAL